MLTAAQQELRENRITASQVGILMSGDEEKILGLWRFLLGLQEPTDLSNVWAVRLGEITESLNLEWAAKKLGNISRMGEVVIGNPSWMCSTLDGWIDAQLCPIECKHTSGRTAIEGIVQRYQPQMHWQMLCTNSKQCVLSVIVGANEPILETILFDQAYAKELMARAASFMLCLETLVPPCGAPKVEAPVQQIRRYDMCDSTEWMDLAARWIQTYGAAQTAKECEKGIKALVPDDASAAYGGGVIVTRNRAGSMSLRRGE